MLNRPLTPIQMIEKPLTIVYCILLGPFVFLSAITIMHQLPWYKVPSSGAKINGIKVYFYVNNM